MDKTDEKKEMKLQPGNLRWNCTKCESLLGFVDQNNSTIRLKYKDHYVSIESGKVSVMCRRCGFLNTVADEDYILFAEYSISLKKILHLKSIKKLKEKETLDKIIRLLNTES